MRAHLLAFLLLAGCPHGAPSAERPVDPCTSVAANVYTAGEGDAAPGSPEEASAHARIAEACRRDAWTSEQTACFSRASGKTGLGACEDTLAESQRSGLEQAFEGGGDAPREAEPASMVGTWSGSFDNLRSDRHVIELTGAKLNYRRPDMDSDWFIEEPYTQRDDGLIVLDRPAAIDDAKDACAGGMFQPPACEVPELACIRVDSVTATEIQLSYGMTCDHLDHQFTGSRQ